MSNYRKLIAALLGTIAVGLTVFGLDENPNTIFGLGVDQLAPVIASILGAIGVWGFSNDDGGSTQ